MGGKSKHASAAFVLAAMTWCLPASPAGAQEHLTREALAGADYVRGRLAFQQRCSACHTLAEDALQGLPIRPNYFVRCFPVAAMAIPRFSEQLWQSPMYGGAVLYGGILPGRPTDNAETAAPE